MYSAVYTEHSVVACTMQRTWSTAVPPLWRQQARPVISSSKNAEQ